MAKNYGNIKTSEAHREIRQFYNVKQNRLSSVAKLTGPLQFGNAKMSVESSLCTYVNVHSKELTTPQNKRQLKYSLEKVSSLQLQEEKLRNRPITQLNAFTCWLPQSKPNNEGESNCIPLCITHTNCRKFENVQNNCKCCL